MEDNKDVETTTTEKVGAEPTAVQNDKTNGEKTFTQSEVDKMFQSRVERVKTEETKQLRGMVESLQQKLAKQEKELAISKYDIDEKYKDYIDFKVSNSTNENINFEKALEEFMAGDGKIYLKDTKVIPTPRPDNQGNSFTSEQEYILKKYGKEI